jgi:hypothetical protein
MLAQMTGECYRVERREGSTFAQGKQLEAANLGGLFHFRLCDDFPLGALASSTLTSYRVDGLLFPAREKTNSPFNGWSKGKAQVDKLSCVTGWVLHDLRSDLTWLF